MANLRERCFCILLTAVVTPTAAWAQSAPTGSHYGGRPLDTGFGGEVGSGGGYSASIPLDLPPARGLPIPLQISYGKRGVGAAGLGWDVPLSYVWDDTSYAGRRPARAAGAPPSGREQIVVVLQGQSLTMVHQGQDWVPSSGAADLLLHRDAATDRWLVYDGSGRTYEFTKPPPASGIGLAAIPMWLLTAISGSGGARLELRYQLDSAVSTGAVEVPAGSGISIDLTHVSYNRHPTKGCFKNDVALLYDPPGNGALSVSVFGLYVLVRKHKLVEVDVTSASDCGTSPVKLRSYSISYLNDQDTLEPRLQTVKMRGLDGTQEGFIDLPLGSYQYGSAVSLSATGARQLSYRKSYSMALPPGADPSAIGVMTEHINFGFLPSDIGFDYTTDQSLIDLSGDGRPDLVLQKNGEASIARNQPGANGTNSFEAVPYPLFGQPLTPALDGALEDRGLQGIRTFTDPNMDQVWRQAIDLNGDGRIDVIDAREESGHWVMYLNQPGAGGSGIVWARRSVPVQDVARQLILAGQEIDDSWVPLAQRRSNRPGTSQTTYTEWSLTDINGDGYPDLVFNSSALVCDYNSCNHDNCPCQLYLPPSNNVQAMLNVKGVLTEVNAGDGLFSAPLTYLSGDNCGVGRWYAQNDDNDDGENMTSECSIEDVNGDGLADRISTDSVKRARLGLGDRFSLVTVALPDFAANQERTPATHLLTVMHNGLRDLTGDGIPDLVTSGGVYIGTSAGLGPRVPFDAQDGFALSVADEPSGGAYSRGSAGVFDVDGDGKPEMVRLNGGALDVYQLIGGAGVARAPEAGKLVRFDNGYGAQTTVSYGSAKDDAMMSHQIPGPEIVVTGVVTQAQYGMGGTLAQTLYAYGGIEETLDAQRGVFAPGSYQRTVALRLIPTTGEPRGDVVVTDRYPLAPHLSGLAKQDEFARYLRAGQVADVTEVNGLGLTDPWALLAGDLSSEPRRISGEHHDWDARLIEEGAVAGAQPGDCVDMLYPYQFDGSAAESQSFDACSAHGFLYGSVTTTWRGTSAPPAANNVATRMKVTSVDDYGHPLEVVNENDQFRTDDDLCVDVAYAKPTTPTGPRVLDALAARKIWDCTRGGTGATYAMDYWSYDNLGAYSVSSGRASSHDYELHAADSGVALSTVHDYDATHDALGHVVTLTKQREDGAVLTETFDYDPFGLAAIHNTISGTGVPSLETSLTLDPVTLNAVATSDANGTQRGVSFDGYGRVSQSTVSAGAVSGVTSVVSYGGFDAGNSSGRRITYKSFVDPVPPATALAAPGRTATTYLDELGRSIRTELALGTDYANQTLIEGATSYDALGRVQFVADAFASNQSLTTAYGTTVYYNPDGTVSCSIRGAGPQPYSAASDEGSERYPTCFSHSFSANAETVATQAADALLLGSPQQNATRYTTLTAVGRLLSRSTLQNGTQDELATFTYDHLGNTTSMMRFQDAANGLGAVSTAWSYDSLGRLIQLQEPETATRNFTYNHFGQLVQTGWTVPAPILSRQLSRSYDVFGRLVHEQEQQNGVADPDTLHDFFYDTGVSVTAQVKPANVLGRLAHAVSPTGEIFFSYDGLGRVAARTFTDDHGLAYVEQRGYHADGSPGFVELDLPDNGYLPERVQYVADSAGRPRSFLFSDSSSSEQLFQAASVDPLGRVLGASYDRSTFAATYASSGRQLLQQARVTSPLGSRQLVFNSYDPLGRERSRSESRNGIASGTTSYSYDALGQLSTAIKSSGATPAFNWQYNHDGLGNLTSLADFLGTADASLSYSSVDRDRVCRIGYGNGGLGGTACNVSYDELGSITEQPTRAGGHRSLTWYASGAVRSISDNHGTQARYHYDAFGGVQELDVSGGGDLRHDRRFGSLIESGYELIGGVLTPVIARRFQGPDGFVASRRGAKGPWVFSFGDGRGNRFFTDNTGAFVQDVDYQPFGESSSTGAQAGAVLYSHQQWNGGDALASLGVAQLGARLYDPVIGRFLSRDPLLQARTGAGSNRYGFAVNDPVNLSDPSGMCPPEICGGGDGSGGDGVGGGGTGQVNADPGGHNPHITERGRLVFQLATDRGYADRLPNFNYDTFAAGMASDPIGFFIGVNDGMRQMTRDHGTAEEVEDYVDKCNAIGSYIAGIGDGLLRRLPGGKGLGKSLRSHFHIESGDANPTAHTLGDLTSHAVFFGLASAVDLAQNPPTGSTPHALGSGQDESGYVNLASEQRTDHVLNGDDGTGGHLWPGGPGKSAFPQDWSPEKIMHTISDIATDPSLIWTQQSGPAGSLFTNAGDPSRFLVIGFHEGITIRVVVEPAGEGIITGYPLWPHPMGP